MSIIYHITRHDAWEKAEKYYAPEMFAVEGFVHCSTREQVVPVANLRFQNQSGLLLLQIDTAKVEAPIVFENLEGGGQLFPHIYGELNKEAVIAISEFNPLSDGNFIFPAPLD